MKLLQSKLSSRLCLLAISVVPTLLFPSIAGAATSQTTASSNEAINAPSIQISSNLSEKLIALSPNQEGVAGLRRSFIRSEGWVQQQYVPKADKNLLNEVSTDKSPSAVDIFQSLQG